MAILYSLFCLAFLCFSYSEGLAIEYCNSYYNAYGTLISSQVCSILGSKCCGTCQSRKCCTNPSQYLNQAKCDGSVLDDNDDDYFDHVVLAFIITASAVVLICLIGCILRLIQQTTSQRRLNRLTRRNIQRQLDRDNVYSISYDSRHPNGAPPPYSTAFEKSYNEQLPPKYEEIQMQNLTNNEHKY